MRGGIGAYGGKSEAERNAQRREKRSLAGAAKQAAAAAAAAAAGLERAAEEAAAAAGLPLLRSDNNASGFKHVKVDHHCKSRPFQLFAHGKSYGYFATGAEAALAYVTSIGKEEAEAEIAGRVHMTVEEALAAAAAEGLPLVRGITKTGFSHVVFDTNGKPQALCKGKSLGYARPRLQARISSVPRAALILIFLA